jgi:hypothetical protein
MIRGEIKKRVELDSEIISLRKKKEVRPLWMIICQISLMGEDLQLVKLTSTNILMKALEGR